jgi:hypothetical protein
MQSIVHELNGDLHLESPIEQRLLHNITRLEDLASKESHSKLGALYGREPLSYSEVAYWRRQFTVGREYVKDARKNG